MLTPVPLLVIGGGAAGLFAGCLAGERGLGALILERKHKPGRKLLMCGNGRCNLTKDIPPAQMLRDMGEPMTAFLAPALNALPPAALQAWFQQHNVPLKKMDDRRVFPRSEQASDVVHALTDALRDTGTALCLNAPVERVERAAERDAPFHVVTAHFSVLARHILIATGGVSYPKTGSVGDGQKFAKALGHSLKPYRPGLIGFVISHPWIDAHCGQTLERAVFRVFRNGQKLYEGDGQLDCETWGVGGRLQCQPLRRPQQPDRFRRRVDSRPRHDPRTPPRDSPVKRGYRHDWRRAVERSRPRNHAIPQMSRTLLRR